MILFMNCFLRSPNQCRNHSTRSSSKKIENEEDEEFQKCIEELQDDDKQEIKLEIDTFLGESGNI